MCFPECTSTIGIPSMGLINGILICVAYPEMHWKTTGALSFNVETSCMFVRVTHLIQINIEKKSGNNFNAFVKLRFPSMPSSRAPCRHVQSHLLLPGMGRIPRVRRYHVCRFCSFICDVIWATCLASWLRAHLPFMQGRVHIDTWAKPFALLALSFRPTNRFPALRLCIIAWNGSVSLRAS